MFPVVLANTHAGTHSYLTDLSYFLCGVTARLLALEWAPPQWGSIYGLLLSRMPTWQLSLYRCRVLKPVAQVLLGSAVVKISGQWDSGLSPWSLIFVVGFLYALIRVSSYSQQKLTPITLTTFPQQQSSIWWQRISAQPDRMSQSGPESVEAMTKVREQETFKNILEKSLEDASAPAVRDSPRPDYYLV